MDNLTDSLTFEGHTFSLDCGVVLVSPPFVGDEPNALELSIAKWRFIVGAMEAGNTVVSCGGSRTCALCRRALFRCCDCPVVVRGGSEESCLDTPYTAFEADPTLENAQAELEFLESLRDE